MILRVNAKRIVMLALLVGSSLSAWGQEQERPRRTFSNMLNVDALIDNYLHVLARKYDLTEDQDAFTDTFVRDKVTDFLNHHYDDLSVLVDQLFDVRTGGEMSIAELGDWGRRVQPIYEDAKQIILEANDEWREILSEEQRRIHDEDVRLMYESFVTTEDQLERIVTGNMTVEEFRHPQRPPATRRQAVARRGKATPQLTRDVAEPRPGDTKTDTTAPANTSTVIGKRVTRTAKDDPRTDAAGKPPARGAKGQSRTSGKAKAGQDSASQWEKYVQDFIERYKLNFEQQERANKILKRCRQQADRHLRSRKPEIDRLDQQMQQVKESKGKNKAQQEAEIKAKRAKLLAPIDIIFEKQLKPRLERIPTRAQREAALKADKSKSAQRGSHKKAKKSAAKGPSQESGSSSDEDSEDNQPDEDED